MERRLKPPAGKSSKHANLVARVSPEAKAALKQLAANSGQTQAAIVDRLIIAAIDNPDGYYLRSAAISAFTAAALARVTLGIVAGDRAQLMTALHVIDNVAKGLFGELPPRPADAHGIEISDSRVEALLEAFGFFDATQ
jgi:predicted DNA-binding protein